MAERPRRGHCGEPLQTADFLNTTGRSAHDVSSSTKVGEDMISIGCVTDMTSSFYIATAIAVFVQFPYRSGRWPIIPRGTVL